jgi:hypothetical protein
MPLPVSTEQAGTLTVASTSSPGVDNTAGPSGGDSVRANENLSASDPVSGNSPRSRPDAPTVQAARQVPSSRNTPSGTINGHAGWSDAGGDDRLFSDRLKEAHFDRKFLRGDSFPLQISMRRAFWLGVRRRD